MLQNPVPNPWRQAHVDELDRLLCERATFESDPLRMAYERGQRAVVQYIRQRVQKQE